MSEAADPDVHARREAVGLALEQGRSSVLALWIVIAAVAWLGQRAGLVWQPLVLLALALVNGLWRLHYLPRFGDRSTLTPQRVLEVERQVQANMLFSGLTWTYASLAIYPHLSQGDGMVFLAIIVGNVSAAAFLTSTVAISYPMLAVPSMLSVLGYEVYRGSEHALLLATLLLVFLAVMLRSAKRLRELTLLSFRRGCEMEQTNRELQQAMIDADAAARAKTRFLATMSHELRTPLNGMMTSLELVGRSDLRAPQRRLVDIARSSGASLLAVLNDVLDYAKLDAGQASIRLVPTELRSLLGSVMELFNATASAKGLALRTQMADEVPPWVMADPQRLRQVLLNLVGNAVKFTDRGEVVLSVQPQAAGLRFEVRDTGIGIAPASLGELFEPFHQVHADSDRPHGGTGLGLTISQRLVQAMGGQIDVRSAPGQGSAFGFVLASPPARAPDRDPAQSPALDQRLPRLSGRVLLVEDNEVNRVLAVELLQMLDLQVEVVENGQQALDRLDAQPPVAFDLVLMDCQMPGIDGYEATRRWRQRERQSARPRIPVLALTANVMAEDIERALAADMDDFLGKPYTFEQLAALLQRWLPGGHRG